MNALMRSITTVITCTYALVLALVSLLPTGWDVSEGLTRAVRPAVQNALHVPAYTGLFLLTAVSLSGRVGNAGLRALLAGVGCAAFGALLETGQLFVPGRTGSVTDVLWNCLGIALGMLVVARGGCANEGGKVTVDGIV